MCIRGILRTVSLCAGSSFRETSMATKDVADVVRFLHGLAGDTPGDEPSDGQLIRRFVERRDQAAFASILLRHGPLVFGVCRQILRDPHAAEDAFQATFFVLAR